MKVKKAKIQKKADSTKSANTHGWTAERRKKQAERIQQWQPWKYSTGARTQEGKARSARNAYKGGQWLETRKLVREMNAMLRRQKQWLGRRNDMKIVK